MKSRKISKTDSDMYVPPLIKDQQVKEKKGLPTCLTHFHLQALQTPFKKKILICLLVAIATSSKTNASYGA
jgi:hypothetical protein